MYGRFGVPGCDDRTSPVPDGSATLDVDGLHPLDGSAPVSDLVEFESNEAYCAVTLDDGGANVMSPDMLGALNDALDRAEAEEQTVLIAGREGTFSGGFDLGVFEESPEAIFEMLRAGAETTERLLSFPHPVVVACTGHAVAMGLFLLLSGDERIGAAGDFALQANEVEIGLTLPHFATELCRHRLAPAHFSRATILAEPYSPEEAVEAGMLDRVVPEEAVVSRARDKAASLTRLDVGSHTATKRRVRADALSRLREGIEADVEDWQSRF